MNERFSYRGRASIDGVQLPLVTLQEDPRDPGDLRSWSGQASFAADDKPDGFSGNLGDSGAVAVELPDGRRGEAIVTNISFDGSAWALMLQGTGPAPA